MSTIIVNFGRPLSLGVIEQIHDLVNDGEVTKFREVSQTLTPSSVSLVKDALSEAAELCGGSTDNVNYFISPPYPEIADIITGSLPQARRIVVSPVMAVLEKTKK